MLPYRFLLAASSVSLVFAVAPRLHANDTISTLKTIEANYAKMDTATLKGDFKTKLMFELPGGESIDETGKVSTFPNGKEDRKKDIARATATLHYSKIQVCKTTIKALTLSGDEVIAAFSRHAEVTITVPNQQPQTGIIDGDIEDVWIRKGNQWLIKRSKVLSAKGIVDGKPYKP